MVMVRVPLTVLLTLHAITCFAEHVPGEVIVGFEDTANSVQIEELERKYSLEVVREFRLTATKHYRVDDEIDLDKLIEKLSANPFVKYAEKNHIIKLQSTDPLFSEQWSLVNTGQEVNNKDGPADIDIDWEQAMERYTGQEPVVVAVVDSGVALDHPEFDQRLWVNNHESEDGLDTDNDGFIDDIIGWDFAEDDNFPLDANGHGTLVASLIAAAPENGKGIAGVAPDALIMPLRVGSNLDVITDSAICASFEYAIIQGADIVNFSISGPSPNRCQFEHISLMDQFGMLFIAAAGNGGSDRRGDDNDDPATRTSYPASFDIPNIISVAALNRSGNLALFSNFGDISVDVAAPGTDMKGADVNRVTSHLEDFEEGASGWTTGIFEDSSSTSGWSLYRSPFGNTWLTDSMDEFGNIIDYSNGQKNWAKSPNIELGANPVLTFETWYDTQLFFDFFVIRTSTDNESWTLLDFKTGTTLLGCVECTTVTLDLANIEFSSAWLRFELLADSFVTADGVYIDDVRIEETTLFEYDGTQYRFNDGTSFSAPIVSGAAAVIWSQKPRMSHLLVKHFLETSVDKTAALEGKVASNGRANLNRALVAMLSDDDSDGLDNADELTFGTDPESADTDDDGVNDDLDAFPLDPGETVDTDGDGVGDNADTDDDGDGFSDELEIGLGSDPKLNDCPSEICRSGSWRFQVYKDNGRR